MVYTGCDNCKYDSKMTDEYPCNECVHGASVKEHFKPMTNADRIRNMSDEELAEFIVMYEVCSRCDYSDKTNDRCTLENPCVYNLAIAMSLKWLQSEVEDNQ